MIMKRFLIGVLALIAAACSPVYAQDMVELTFGWNEPVVRENGDPLPAEEIGGYEFRFYENAGTEFQAVIMPREGSPITGYSVMVPEGNHEYTVAAYDTDGLFSEFVSITASVNNPSQPGSVTGFDLTIVRPSVDRVQECRDDRPECNVMGD